jgi:hypothetical protein
MRTAMIAIVLGTSLLGCKMADGGASASSTGGSTEADEELTPTEALGKKNSAYVKCLNAFSDDVFRGRRDWLQTFPKGPTPKQASAGTTLYGPAVLDDPKECREGIKAAKAFQPSLPALEAAGEAYVAVLAEIHPITVRLQEYFKQGDYKDDNLALAIEMHPKLVAAWEKFVPAEQALSEEVDKVEDKINAGALDEIAKKEGKGFRWHHRRMLINAKAILPLASAAKTPVDIKDPAALQAAITAFDTAATELLAYYTKNKESIEKKHISYDTWVSGKIKEFLKASKELMRRNRDKRALTSSELDSIKWNRADSIEGHPAQVIKAYNELIQASNRLRF